MHGHRKIAMGKQTNEIKQATEWRKLAYAFDPHGARRSDTYYWADLQIDRR